ncbi:cytosine deaminase [Pestalotiopsis sp. 9143b]|nr:cytosine deaminase [Pestalotiopsis sp. 9143b]
MALDDAKFLALAYEEAKAGYDEGGIPGETSALQNAGRLSPDAYKGATMYTTLSPCDMCTGACLLFGIPRVVVGENKSWLGGEAYLQQRGVEVVVMDDKQCLDLMQKFMAEKPEVWNEDVGGNLEGVGHC